MIKSRFKTELHYAFANLLGVTLSMI